MISLVYHPDERLQQKVEPVDNITGDVARLTDKMVTLMHDAKGIGLAGPQVSWMGRLFVVHVPDDKSRVFINPRIVAVSPDDGLYEEGCLSIPGVYADVRRPLAISVEAFDREGNPFSLDADGILARVIQHEYDHLEGVLFFERLTRRKQERLLKNYRKPGEE